LISVLPQVNDQSIAAGRTMTFPRHLRGDRALQCHFWAQKCRRKISLWKVAQFSGDPAEFRPQRLFAFELQGWEAQLGPSAS